MINTERLHLFGSLLARYFLKGAVSCLARSPFGSSLVLIMYLVVAFNLSTSLSWQDKLVVFN